MKYIFTLLLFSLSACASYSPSINDAPDGKTVVYNISIEQAKRIVSTTMSSHFAGREVLPLELPAIGFTTYTRMLADTWSTTVTIIPVLAKSGQTEVTALKIDLRGTGTSFFTGRIHYENFKDRLSQELANTGKLVTADSYLIN